MFSDFDNPGLSVGGCTGTPPSTGPAAAAGGPAGTGDGTRTRASAPVRPASRPGRAVDRAASASFPTRVGSGMDQGGVHLLAAHGHWGHAPRRSSRAAMACGFCAATFSSSRRRSCHRRTPPRSGPASHAARAAAARCLARGEPPQSPPPRLYARDRMWLASCSKASRRSWAGGVRTVSARTMECTVTDGSGSSNGSSTSS